MWMCECVNVWICVDMCGYVWICVNVNVDMEMDVLMEMAWCDVCEYVAMCCVVT